MDIGGAIKALKEGKKVTRKEWQRYSADLRYLVMIKVKLGFEKELKDVTFARPAIWLRDFDGSFFPTTFSQLDILAEDYIILKEG